MTRPDPADLHAIIHDARRLRAQTLAALLSRFGRWAANRLAGLRGAGAHSA